MLDRLSQADRIVGASALVTLLSTFMPWYRFDQGQVRITLNAFGTGFLGDVVFFAAVGAVALLLIRHDVIRVPRTVVDDRAELVVGSIALGAVLLQLLIGVNGSGAFRSATIGIAVALLASAGMVVGGYLRRQQRAPLHRLSSRPR